MITSSVVSLPKKDGAVSMTQSTKYPPALACATSDRLAGAARAAASSAEVI